MSNKRPTTLNSKLMHKAKTLGDQLFARRANLRETAGEPFKSEELSPAERKKQYQELIASRDLLMGALTGAAIIGRDGRLRISNKIRDAFIELRGE